MSEPAAILRAVAAQPEDDTVRLAYADWLDENDDPREAALQRVIARPADDALRILYADAIEPMGSDYEIHAEIIRAMVARPEWFRDREWRDFYTSKPWPAKRHELVDTVNRSLDLVAWSDLDIRTAAIPGEHIWHRATGGDDVHDDIRVTFSRGFVSEVRTTQNTFLVAAGDLFRHPVERVTLADKRPWRDVHGRWAGWWDCNHAVAWNGGGSDDASTLTTDIMKLMSDDPRRCDATLSLRFDPGRTGIGGCIMFKDEDDAIAALIRAALLHGRRRAAIAAGAFA